MRVERLERVEGALPPLTQHCFKNTRKKGVGSPGSPTQSTSVDWSLVQNYSDWMKSIHKIMFHTRTSVLPEKTHSLSSPPPPLYKKGLEIPGSGWGRNSRGKSLIGISIGVGKWWIFSGITQWSNSATSSLVKQIIKQYQPDSHKLWVV